MDNTLNDVQAFLNNQRWIYSRNYADKAPHEYCLLQKVNGTKEDFQKAARYIFENGIQMNFWSLVHNYLFFDGRMYWIMDKDPCDAVLINRCNIDEYKISVTWRGRK